MKISFTLFAFVTILASATCFAETPVAVQKIVPESPKISTNDNGSAWDVSNQSDVSSINLTGSEIYFSSDAGQTKFNANLIDLKSHVFSNRLATPASVATAIYDELKSTARHYRIYAATEKKNWFIEELEDDKPMSKVLTRISMQEFAETAFQKRQPAQGAFDLIEKYLRLNLCNTTAPQNPNGQSADQLAVEQAPPVTGPSTEINHLAVGTAL
jgi:hypothetical protein